MKKSIVSSALFLLFSTGVFAATPVKDSNNKDIKSTVSINGLHSNIGVSVSVSDNLNQKTVVRITDKMGYPFYAENLPNRVGSIRSYDLSQLENGDYMITVSTKKQEIKKQVHIYDESGKKTYFLIQ